MQDQPGVANIRSSEVLSPGSLQEQQPALQETSALPSEQVEQVVSGEQISGADTEPKPSLGEIQPGLSLEGQKEQEGESQGELKSGKKGKNYPEAEPSNNVYLWGIPSTFTDADLSLLVFACGNVVSVRMGPPTNKPHTYAFAQFNKKEEAKKAIELLNSRKLNSRELVVRYAKPPPVASKHKTKKNNHAQMMYNTFNPAGMGALGGTGSYDDRKGGFPYPMEMYHMAYQTQASSGGQGPMNVMGQGSGMGMNGMSPVPSLYPPTHQMRNMHLGNKGLGSKPLLSATNIYISGLPKDVTPGMLEELFGRFGKVVSTKVIMNRHTGMPLGTALVRMDSNQSAAICIDNLNGIQIEGGYQLSCRFANEKKRSGISTSPNPTSPNPSAYTTAGAYGSV